MVKKKHFNMYESGLKDVELRDIKPQWKNSKVGDIATFLCGKRILRKKIKNIHRGTFGAIVYEVGGYRRIFPNAKNVLEMLREKKQLYPEVEEFLGFELE
jgi:ASC-1-like (ASCH) protein